MSAKIAKIATTLSRRLPPVKASIAKKLPAVKAGLAKVGTAVKVAAVKSAGLAKAAATSKIGKVALGAAAIGGGIGLGAYLSTTGLAAGQAYGQYATQRSLYGQPVEQPPLFPWSLGEGQLLGAPEGYGGVYQIGGPIGSLPSPAENVVRFFTSPFVLLIILLIIGGYFLIKAWKSK